MNVAGERTPPGDGFCERNGASTGLCPSVGLKRPRNHHSEQAQEETKPVDRHPNPAEVQLADPAIPHPDPNWSELFGTYYFFKVGNAERV